MSNPNEKPVELLEYLQREARELAQDLGLEAKAIPSAESIAAEMKRRSDHLRSRPMQKRTADRERLMLRELDAIEADARAVVRGEACGTLSPFEAAAECEALSLAAFAVRGRYHDLLRSQDEPWPSRASPESGEARRAELDAIEAFLERKRIREAAQKAG